jgi:hypothetical protein
MAKSATVKIEEYLNECHGTKALLKEFSDVAKDKYGTYAYASGYFETMMADLIMELPKKRREELRTQLHNQAYKMETAAA